MFDIDIDTKYRFLHRGRVEYYKKLTWLSKYNVAILIY